MSAWANALAGRAVVVGGQRAKSREIIALVGRRAPSSSGVEGEAVSAVVVGGTTAGDQHTSSLGGAPGVIRGADASTSGAVVVVRASCGDIIALVGSRAPSRAWVESEAVAASVAGQAAAGNGNTAVGLGAVSGSGPGTNALTSGAVVLVWAVGQVVARVSGRAPGSSGVEGQATAAVVISGAARRDLNA